MKKFQRGITLVEILLTIGITVLLLSITLPLGWNVYQVQQLDAERNNLVSLLRRAESLALSNYQKTSHGVYISPNSYIVFQGSSYASRAAAFDEITQRSQIINISGTTEIVFSAPSGLPNASSASFVLNTGERSRTVTINEQGTINW